jgi:hypothetical protein
MRPFGDLPARSVFLQTVLQSHQQRCVILGVDILALWKIINEEVTVLINHKKSRRELYQRIFHSEFFGAGRGEVSRYAAIPLSVGCGTCITRFSLWSPIATGNHLDRAKKIPKFAQTSGTIDVFFISV